MRFQQPRALEATETADSLAHWVNQFEVYITRDAAMSPFLTGTWNPALPNMGCVATETLTVQTVAQNCKLFLAHVCSFFK